MTTPASSSSEPYVAALKPVVRVKADELLPLLALTLWIFLALTAYYVIKPLRSEILQDRIGVDNKWIALLATTIFVGLVAYGYGRIVPHTTRARLINATFAIFIACLAAFALLLPHGGRLSGYLFFVWVSTFNLMIVSQFWSLAADVWNKEEGSRLFGFIGVGGVCGGIFGTLVVAKFAKSLESETMLLMSAGVLGLCFLLARYLLNFSKGRRAPTGPAKPSLAPGVRAEQKQNAVRLVLGSPYLRLIALMMLLLNVVNSNNEWILDKMVSRQHMASGEIREFFGRFYLFQNVITFGIQFFLTARVQTRFGARVALFFEPLIGILGGGAFVILPILPVIYWHKIFENATDYSIQSNTKELLYLPLSTIEKYSAKNFNDTFVVRGGDALAAGSIFIVTSLVIPAIGDLGIKLMIGFDILLGVAWLFIANRVGRLHAGKMGLAPSQA